MNLKNLVLIVVGLVTIGAPGCAVQSAPAPEGDPAREAAPATALARSGEASLAASPGQPSFAAASSEAMLFTGSSEEPGALPPDAPVEEATEQEVNRAEAKAYVPAALANQSRWIQAVASHPGGFVWFWIVDEPAANSIDVYAYPQYGKQPAYHWHAQSDDKAYYTWVKGCGIGNQNGCWHGDMWAGNRNQEWDHLNAVARSVMGAYKAASHVATPNEAVAPDGTSIPDSIAGCIGNAVVMAAAIAGAGIACTIPEPGHPAACPIGVLFATGQMAVTFDACGAHF